NARSDPALVPGAVDDFQLDLLDGDRVLVDAKHTCRLARRRTEPSRKFGKVVGRVQPLDGISPVLAIDQVVPVRNQIAEWTAVVAERNAAVHTPAGLCLELVSRKRGVDLLPIQDACLDGSTLWCFALPLQEAGGFTHARPPSPGRGLPRSTC